MATISDYFIESQAQLTESQKKLKALWDESQKELMESQKKLTEAWTESLPKGTTQVDTSETFEKSLNFQRELISSVLNTQQVTTHLAIEAQKQLWDTYFQTTEKMKPKAKSS